MFCKFKDLRLPHFICFFKSLYYSFHALRWLIIRLFLTLWTDKRRLRLIFLGKQLDRVTGVWLAVLLVTFTWSSCRLPARTNENFATLLQSDNHRTMAIMSIWKINCKLTMSDDEWWQGLGSRGMLTSDKWWHGLGVMRSDDEWCGLRGDNELWVVMTRQWWLGLGSDEKWW